MKYEVRGKGEANTRLSKVIHQKCRTIERSNQLHREIRCAIENAPDFWLPGLLQLIVRQCEERKIFRKGGINRIVTHATEIKKTGSIRTILSRI
jgi:hypothetical protein